MTLVSKPLSYKPLRILQLGYPW